VTDATEPERRQALRVAIGALAAAEAKRDAARAAHQRGVALVARLEHEAERYADVDDDATRAVNQTLEHGGEQKWWLLLPEQVKRDATRRDEIAVELRAAQTATVALEGDLSVAERAVAVATQAVTDARDSVLSIELQRLADEHADLLAQAHALARKLAAGRRFIDWRHVPDAVLAATKDVRGTPGVEGWRAAGDMLLSDPDVDIVIPEPAETVFPKPEPPRGLQQVIYAMPIAQPAVVVEPPRPKYDSRIPLPGGGIAGA
jgi:hypothetical protein